MFTSTCLPTASPTAGNRFLQPPCFAALLLKGIGGRVQVFVTSAFALAAHLLPPKEDEYWALVMRLVSWVMYVEARPLFIPLLRLLLEAGWRRAWVQGTLGFLAALLLVAWASLYRGLLIDCLPFSTCLSPLSQGRVHVRLAWGHVAVAVLMACTAPEVPQVCLVPVLIGPGCPPGLIRGGGLGGRKGCIGRGEVPTPSPPPTKEPTRVTGQVRPRSPKTVQSAEGEQGKEKRERIIVVVRSPCQENYPADAHPSALKSVLESANPRMDSECASGCTWSTARATACLRDSQPWSSQTGQVIRGLR